MAEMNNILSIIEDYLECRKILSEYQTTISQKLQSLIDDRENQIESAAKSIKAKETEIQALRSELLSHVDLQKPEGYDFEYHAKIQADHEYLKRALCKLLGKEKLSSSEIVQLLEKKLKSLQVSEAHLKNLLRVSKSKTQNSLMAKIKRWQHGSDN